jgi:hypothetical protein
MRFRYLIVTGALVLGLLPAVSAQAQPASRTSSADACEDVHVAVFTGR